MIHTSGNKIISTPTKRKIRKVSGGEYGKPNLATTKPVLQIRTKASGTRLNMAGFPATGVMRIIIFQGVSLLPTPVISGVASQRQSDWQA